MSAPHVTAAIGLMYSSACSSVINLSKSSPDSAARLMRFLILDAVDVLTNLSSYTVSKGRLNVFNSVQRSTCDYLNIKKEKSRQSLNAYFDPNNKEVNIINYTCNISAIECYNNIGKKVNIRPYISTFQDRVKIKLSHLNMGIYYISVYSVDGQRQTLRFVKS